MNEQVMLPLEKLPLFLYELIAKSEALDDDDLPKMEESFAAMFPIEDGAYIFDRIAIDAWLQHFTKRVLDDTLFQMVQDGFLQLGHNGDDFTFELGNKAKELFSE